MKKKPGDSGLSTSLLTTHVFCLSAFHKRLLVWMQHLFLPVDVQVLECNDPMIFKTSSIHLIRAEIMLLYNTLKSLCSWSWQILFSLLHMSNWDLKCRNNWLQASRQQGSYRKKEEMRTKLNWSYSNTFLIIW